MGLTSPGNLAFVKSLNCFDQVLSYQETDQIDDEVRRPHCLMLRATRMFKEYVHSALWEKKYFTVVASAKPTGTTRQVNRPTAMPGPSPVFWSGPDQLMKMRGELGEAGFVKAAQLSMQDFLATAMTWIKLDVTTDG